DVRQCSIERDAGQPCRELCLLLKILEMQEYLKKCLLADFFRIFAAPSNEMSDTEYSFCITSHHLFNAVHVSSLRGMHKLDFRGQVRAELVLISLHGMTRPATGKHLEFHKRLDTASSLSSTRRTRYRWCDRTSSVAGAITRLHLRSMRRGITVAGTRS